LTETGCEVCKAIYDILMRKEIATTDELYKELKSTYKIEISKDALKKNHIRKLMKAGYIKPWPVHTGKRWELGYYPIELEREVLIKRIREYTGYCLQIPSDLTEEFSGFTDRLNEAFLEFEDRVAEKGYECEFQYFWDNLEEEIGFLYKGIERLLLGLKKKNEKKNYSS
jgi:hypothetical protein